MAVNSRNEREGTELLQQIIHQKDPDAFARLVERYENDAYHLAVRITGNRALAEEAVQDALLSVWRSASTFRADGNARSWVLRIVACRSMKIARKQRRERVHTACHVAIHPAIHESSAEQALERRELISELKRSLTRLSAPEQRLMDLYQHSGLSQRQMGKYLSLPQRTVSNRLRTTHSALLAGLIRAGVA